MAARREPNPKKYCVLCHEYFDEEADPYHIENCRDAVKP